VISGELILIRTRDRRGLAADDATVHRCRAGNGAARRYGNIDGYRRVHAEERAAPDRRARRVLVKLEQQRIERGLELEGRMMSVEDVNRLMKNFIDAVPVELEHAAAIDGASTFRILRELVLPLTLPGIAVTSIYTFINAWGAFIIPFVLVSNPEDQPGPIEIYNFMGSHGLFKFGDLADLISDGSDTSRRPPSPALSATTRNG
jgi:hypothetical protein